MKKVIAFDLDDTLAISKGLITDEMGSALVDLLEKYDVCIISGGKYEQFKTQIVDRLEAPEHLLSKLHLMPTCGTRYYRYDELEHEWQLQYAEDLTEEQKKVIVHSLETRAKELGMWVKDTYGPIIEDRLSQITYSALGQQAPPEEKYKWADRFAEEKKVLREKVAQDLPGLEVRLGGSTSVDVTRIGIDKAYGMRKLMDAIDVSMDEILFLGDKLQEGGNDYPVKAMGIDTLEVKNYETTPYVVRGILGVTS